MVPYGTEHEVYVLVLDSLGQEYSVPGTRTPYYTLSNTGTSYEKRGKAGPGPLKRHIENTKEADIQDFSRACEAEVRHPAHCPTSTARQRTQNLSRGYTAVVYPRLAHTPSVYLSWVRDFVEALHLKHGAPPGELGYYMEKKLTNLDSPTQKARLSCLTSWFPWG